VKGIAVAPSGDLYILDGEWAATVLRKVGTDGIMRTVVGTVTPCSNETLPCGDNGPAALAGVGPGTNSVSATPNGGILLTNRERVRHIDVDGLITTVAGLSSPSSTYGGDNSPTLQTTFNWAGDAEMGPDGKLYVLDQLGYRVVRGMPPFSVLATQNIKVASEDGQEAYVFTPAGRHLQTIDVLTNRVLLTFGYDAAGRLLSVTDVDGNVTTIQRDGTGKPLAIVGPFGQTNSLTLDANGYLATVTNPKTEVTQVQHGPSGLLATLTDPKGNPPHEFTYGESGWLTRDEDPTGGFKALTRTETDSGFKVALTTGMGRATSYEMAFVADGSVRRTITDAAGLVTRALEGADKTLTIKSPTGDSVRTTLGPDSRFSMQSPVAKTFSIRLPSGLEATGRQVRTGTLSNPDDPFSLVTLRDSLIFNGRIATSVYDAATRTRTSTSPQGRQSVTKLDSTGRVIEERVTGVAPVKYNYGQRGFLTSVTQAGRVLQYDYDSTGQVKKITDPFGRTEQFLYDSAGRVVTQTLPDGRQILYGYDANGNLTSLTPPTKPAHTFTFNAANQDSIYSPPAAGLSSFKTKYSYNLDRQLTQILRPDSQTIAIAYDTAGRTSVLTLPNGSSTFGYSPTTGMLTSLTSPTGGSLAFTYDGSLPKTATWSGTVAGSVGHNYDASFRVTSITVNGANSISLGYDNDDLLTSVGSLSLSRDAQNGRLTGTTLANMITAHAYDDSIGTLKRSTARFSNDTLLDFQYTRDTLDRITQLIERVQGTTQTWTYAYDSIGRLDQVRLGGVLVSDYTYDGNGNRLGLTTQSGSVTGTVDDQDRLLTWGTNSYTYTSNGELKMKVSGSDTTRYTYDVLGNLLQVVLPNATTIDYLVDGQSRRIGRKLNGVLSQGFLYDGQLAPIAELNGSNQVVSRFVYGTRANVPEYVIKGGVTYRILSDHLGSVRLVVNTSSGVITQRIDYDEFGRVTQNTNPGFQPFGFAGGLYDESTKLARFGARDYDAETGRWTAKDPIGLNGDGPNFYAYVGNAPINRIDPSGLWSVSISWYWGFGGTLTVGNSNGSNFVNVNAGVGIGAGVSFAPGGGFPGGTDLGDLGGYIGFSGGIDAGAGPASATARYRKGGQVTRNYDYQNPTWTPSEEPFEPGVKFRKPKGSGDWKLGGKVSGGLDIGLRWKKKCPTSIRF
jgi:RHS repeat-associated protein